MYSTETYKMPFWAENSGFMTGRDPLGIQNTSIATYSRLLPGMTNLTQRLRYYGFYMWVLYEYDSKYGNDDSSEALLEHHYNFIRRSELIIAYLMVNAFPDQPHIVGSDYANRFKSSIDLMGYYNISIGADKLKETIKGSVYWDYKSGAFGQYYAPSLINLGLISSKEQFYCIEELGKELALAFEKSIGKDSCNLFLTIIESGTLSKAQIDELKSFSISKIPKYSDEWSFYNKLLASDDGEVFKRVDGKASFQRLETIKHYLTFIEKPEHRIENGSFMGYQYKLNLKDIQEDASFGWYYYYMIEALHYAVETVFWGFLTELDGKVVVINNFIQTLCNSIASESLNKFIKSDQQTVENIINDIQSSNFILSTDIENLSKTVRSPVNSIVAISMAFELIFKIYIENIPNVTEIESFEKSNLLKNRNGSATQIMNGFIKNNLSAKYIQFIESFIKRIMNEHIYNAYRKMGDGESNLLKFVIEDNNITLIQTMEPKFTSPRIQSLHNFLTDLGYIDVDGKLVSMPNNIFQS